MNDRTLRDTSLPHFEPPILGRSESEKAKAYLRHAADLLDQLCSLADEAKKDGMLLSYGTGDDKRGRHVVTLLKLVKVYELLPDTI